MNKEEFEKMSDLALRRLACAIVYDAVKDYQAVLEMSKIYEIELAYLRGEDNEKGVKEINVLMISANRKKRLIEKFFRSRKFERLAPQLDAEAVREEIETRVKNADMMNRWKMWKRRYDRRKQKDCDNA